MSDHTQQLIRQREHEDGELLRARFFDRSTDDSRSRPPDPKRPHPRRRRPPVSPITPRRDW
jgi:hypothetical protein